MFSPRTTLQSEINDLREAGLYKEERVITTPQSAKISTTKGKEVLNFCANNYLGLSSHCLLYTSPSPRDQRGSRMPSSA